MDVIKDKYLVFTLEKDFFAIPLKFVQEVISFQPITPLYDASTFLKGVINLRGKIIPVIDLRLKFHLPEAVYSDRTIFIILTLEWENQPQLIGLIVDAVKDVITITQEEIQNPREVGFRFKSRYIYGIAKSGEHIVIILDIEKILLTEEIIQIHEVTKE